MAQRMVSQTVCRDSARGERQVLKNRLKSSCIHWQFWQDSESGVIYKGWIKSSGNTSVVLKLLYYLR
jgi:hypothetical protein